MAGKKHISAKEQKNSDPLPGDRASAKNVPPSFWERLSENKAKLFLYQKICVFLVAFLVFANGIPNGFNMDDVYYTTPENPIANMGVKAIPQIFTTHTLHDNSNNDFDYRPVTMLTFALQHQYLNGSPQLSHFINVLLYSFICLLVFTLLCYWFGPSKSWFALFVALLYAVHPLHTEVVDSIKSRDELLSTLFGVLCMLSAWKWQLTKKAKYAIFSFIFLVIGKLCKETIILYVMVIPISFYFFSDMPIRKIILPFLVLFVSYFLVSGITEHFLPEQKRIILFYENPMYFGDVPLAVKTATISYILGWYAYLHLIPYPLSFYYGYRYIELVYWSSFTILYIVVYSALIFLVIKNIRKKSIIGFGTLVYLVCIFPFSNIGNQPTGIMAERFTVASSLGYCILLVSVLYYLCKVIPGAFITNKNSKYLIAVFSLIFISYAGLSIERNTQWESSWTLFSHDIQHLQKSVKANMFYGEQVRIKVNGYRNKYMQVPDAEKRLYMDSIFQYMPEEKQPFLRALAGAPGYFEALNNLGVAYINEDSAEIGKKYLLQARESAPNNIEIRANLAIAYGRIAVKTNNSAWLDSAVNEYKSVVNINPKYPPVYGDLSVLYLQQKDTVSAINTLLSAIKNIPTGSLSYIQLAQIYFYKGDTAHAIYYEEKGAELPDPDPMLLQMLQSYYREKNDIQKESYYKNKMKQMAH